MSKAIFGALLCATSLFAQDLYQLDTAIGLGRHQEVTGKSRVIELGEAHRRLQKVFGNMINAPSFSGGASIKHQLFLLDDPVVNAYAAGGGRMYITQGLMQSVGDRDGVLAFVMGHEMVHNRNQHGARRYLRSASYDYEYRKLYINSGALAADIYKTGVLIAERKLQRDEEHQADQIGLRIAAEAGYHPDFAILAARALRAETGEASKFAAFFSSHPRWTTREERSEKNYEDALAIFETRWPSVMNSPGGRPPAIASLSPVKIDKTKDAIVIRTAAKVRNLMGKQAELTVAMFGEREPHPVVLERRTYTADRMRLDTVQVSIDKKAFKGKKGKYFVVVVVASPETVLAESKPERVK